MVGKILGAIIVAIVGSLLSAAVSVASGLIGAALQKKQGPRRVESPSRARKQNLTDTTAYIPVVVGRARSGGSRVFGATKLAFRGTETISSNGVEIIQDTEGRFLYLKTIHSFGEIDDIEEVYLDNIAITDSKYSDGYKVTLTFDWTYTEPSPVTVVTQPTGYRILGIEGNLLTYQTQNGAVGVTTVDSFYTTYRPERYTLLRKLTTESSFKIIKQFGGGVQTYTFTNGDYGDYDYKLEYTADTGEVIEVGNATVTIALENSGFVQSVNNNLTVTQDSQLISEFVQFIEKRGAAGQTAITEWVTQSVPEYTSDMIGAGLAYSGLRLLKHTKGNRAERTPIQNIPNVTADIRGIKVYDPRLDSTNTEAGGSGSHRENDPSTWEWSENPALIIRNYLVNTEYGARLDSSLIDDATIASEADYCEGQVTYNSETFDRYVCNGIIDTGNRVVDNLLDLLDSCNGKLYFNEGIAQLKILKPESSVFSFDISNITGDISIQKGNIRNKVNTVNVKYVSEALNWETDIITIKNNSFIAEDKNKVYESDIDLSYTTDYNHAYFLGIQFLKQSRLTTVIQFKAFWGSYQVVPGDVVDVTHPDLGYSSKLFRVEKMEAGNDGLINFELTEYDADVYTVDNIDPRANDAATNLDNPFEVQAPTNIQVLQTFTFDNQANFSGNLVTLEWNPSTSPNIIQYQVDFKPLGLGEWEILGTTTNTTLSTSDMLVGVYDVRVKAINNLSIESAYTQKQIEIFALTDNPPDVQGFKLQNSNNEVSLSWFAIPELANGGYYRVRHSPNVQNADWSDSPTFDILVPGYQTSVTLSQLDGTYLIKAGNTAGLESDNFASVVLDLPDNVDWQIVETVQEDPTFDGTKVNTAVSGSSLILVGDILWDSQSGLFDDKGGLFDDGSGFVNVGTYSFDNSVDLGAIYTVKLRKDVQADVSAGNENFDDAMGFFDQRAGLWDGDTPINAAVNTIFRTSRDGITYSDWQLLTINETTGRYFEFGAELFTNTVNESITVNQLRTEVLLRQRLEQDTGTTSAVSDVTINFNSAFYNTPIVSAVIDNPSTGDYIDISNITTTGFDISARDSGGSRVVRNISYIAQGLGQRFT